MKLPDIRDALKDHGLKVTPQRIAVLQAIMELKNHPTAEQLIEFIKINNPSVAIGTVYKILDMLVEKGLIRKVKTDRDVMRYDAEADNHHHLYCYDSDRIEDYFDEELDMLLNEYFTSKDIPGFEIQDVKLQIIGKFSKNNK
jgi:Fur family peroxide stress response transcriptional regulator